MVIAAGFAGYMAARMLAKGSEAAAFANANDLLRLEAQIGIDIEARVQRLVLDHSPLRSLSNFVYAWTYWPAIVGTLVGTWWKRRALFVLFRNSLLVSGGIGLVIFAVYPVAPPRFLPGFVDTVEASDRSHFIAYPSAFVNKFAAMPSFHIGWVALASVVWMLATDRRWLRCLIVILPVAMAIAVVATANHYVVDIIAGVALTLGSLVLAQASPSKHVPAVCRGQAVRTTKPRQP